MELCSIASGSSGNCILAGEGSCRLLIDAGISGTRIERGLNALGHKTSEMQAILITHEHSDHIGGLGVIARKYGLPIYATKQTKEAILNMPSAGAIDPALFHTVTADQAFQIGELAIEPIRISHDAADPVAYILKSGSRSAGVVTDLGTYDAYLLKKLQGLNLLLLEANHDVQMLLAGPYPYFLKQRILGNRGHLSNELCGRLLAKMLHDGFGAVLLGHLSKENNFSQLAYEAVKLEITMADCAYQGDDFPIHIAEPDSISKLISV